MGREVTVSSVLEWAEIDVSLLECPAQSLRPFNPFHYQLYLDLSSSPSLSHRRLLIPQSDLIIKLQHMGTIIHYTSIMMIEEELSNF